MIEWSEAPELHQTRSIGRFGALVYYRHAAGLFDRESPQVWGPHTNHGGGPGGHLGAIVGWYKQCFLMTRATSIGGLALKYFVKFMLPSIVLVSRFSTCLSASLS